MLGLTSHFYQSSAWSLCWLLPVLGLPQVTSRPPVGNRSVEPQVLANTDITAGRLTGQWVKNTGSRYVQGHSTLDSF